MASSVRRWSAHRRPRTGPVGISGSIRPHIASVIINGQAHPSTDELTKETRSSPVAPSSHPAESSAEVRRKATARVTRHMHQSGQNRSRERTPATGDHPRRAPRHHRRKKVAGNRPVDPRGDRSASPASPHVGSSGGALGDDRGRRDRREGSSCTRAPGKGRAGRTRHPVVGPARQGAPTTLGAGACAPRFRGAELRQSRGPTCTYGAPSTWASGRTARSRTSASCAAVPGEPPEARTS